MKIQVTKKNQYGRERVFPVNGLAQSLLVFVGRKTYTEDELLLLASEGFEIEYVTPPNGVGGE